MATWTPQTGEMQWIYTYQDEKFQGLRLTHQPSPWMGDYGQFSLMPMTGKLITDDRKRSSAYKHANEVSTPYYYSAYLDDYQIRAEVSPGTRTGMLRFTFPDADSAYLIIDASDAAGSIEIIPEKRMIKGYSTINSGGVPEGFAHYFVAIFDQEFEDYGIWENEEIIEDKNLYQGNNIGSFLRFTSQRGDQVQVRVGTSFISHAQALLNLEREIGDQSFENFRQKAKDTWNQELSRIEIEGANEEQLSVFYTAYYRMLMFPRIWHEPDQEGKMHHFSPYDGKVHPGVLYADNGFWDTFRAVFPFYTLMYPERDAEIIRGLINAYQEGDWFPKWTSPGYRNVMIGTHTASLITDAYEKGIRDFDVEKAYEGMVKDVMALAPPGGPGRTGNPHYLELGYVPTDKVHEATARTLEYAYGDFCVGKLAERLGKDSEQDFFYHLAYNYRNVYDSEVGFMRGRNADGSWRPDFSPIEWGGPFTEGGSWHYTWSVMQDIDGLIDLMGGPAAFAEKLDLLFDSPPEFEVGAYGNEIHEMTEMVAGNMGQYAHGNQPVHHLIYLYNHAGQPWKTQYWVREVMDRLYGPGPDGHCGDEDNGQMSAWYVFSAMGFYPVTPGVPQYVLGAPRFKKMTLHLPSGKDFVIEAPHNSDKNRYVQAVKLNGNPYGNTWIDHQSMINGGNIQFQMGPEPREEKVSEAAALPFSLSQAYPLDELDQQNMNGPTIKSTAEKPVIKTQRTHFRENLTISLAKPKSGVTIYYTTDGSTPDENSQTYSAPFEITQNTILKTISYHPDRYKSSLVRQEFIRLPNNYEVPQLNHVHPNYQAAGGISLIDGMIGSRNFHDGRWIGIQGNNFEAVVDLKQPMPITGIGLGCLEDQGSWIFLPEKVSFYGSENGRDYFPLGVIDNPLQKSEGKSRRKTFILPLENTEKRAIVSVKVIAQNIGTCPKWHRGAGGQAFIFVDEISIQR
jgi:predicted alpha-1,2-mannosidase